MASMEETKLPLKLLVDKERNRVAVAEAGGDLVDTLFSFLTLPLGTIIRLLSNKHGKDEAKEIGCINNLYQSVESSNDEVFWNKICKRMLLSPRNPCEELCQKLKLKVDDTEPMKYFMCSNKCKRDDGVFVKGGTMYLIFDDLRVLQSSPGKSVQQLLQLGYKNFHNLTQKSLNVGLNEM
ncbi:hypothetical protein VNO78_25939 [Psophocarpus tetragonolobus]|uniref:Uncharacterized protein n=1 Tax=Psophocarpus tetragonolobus TaxID=3891 RepID=A0AAN9XFV8_PSOTE